MLFRYVFVALIAYFLWQGVTYLLDEREIKNLNRAASAMKQRVIIICFHLIAFLIMGYKTGEFLFDERALITGGAGLLFFIGAMILTTIVYRKGCPLLWNGVFFLLDIGFVMLYRLDTAVSERQLMYAALGFGAAMLMPLMFNVAQRIAHIPKVDIVYYILSIALLSLPFFIGDRRGGSLNWIEIHGVRFQPSEVVKFFFVFYLASTLKRKRGLAQLAPSALAAASLTLILVMQKDLGGALIFFMTYMIMLYISTGKEWLFFLGMGAASGGAWMAYRIFSHVRERVSIWIDPWADPYDTGLQILQSLFAINTWGVFGSGLTLGMPKHIPVVTSDMIFSALCEEFGGIFGLCVIGVFIMVFYRGVNIALRSGTAYSSLLAAGFTGLFTFQTFLILGGATKFIPLTGVTLPFVSAGGSSVVVSILMIGILQSIMRQNLIEARTRPDLDLDDDDSESDYYE
jgi:cell division protein FtsW (lipid II flippase)